MHSVEAVLGLVVLATAVAALADRLRTPAPSLLVLVGLAVGYLPGVPATQVTPDLVMLGVLPPLLFAAAQQVSLIALAAVWRPVVGLAVGLVAVTAAAVAGVTHAVYPAVGVSVAFTLGAILASTDPVAVTALSRRLRLPERLGTLVQAESLFNDATSLVLFQVAVAATVAGHMSVGTGVVQFVRLAGGGVVVGVVVGVLAGLLLTRASEPTLQAAVALITPYAAAVTAQALAVSSVTAVIVTGLMLARRRSRSRQPSGRLMASSVYDTAVFVLESVIFAVIGLELATFLRALPSGDAARAGVLVAVVTVTLLVVRAAALASTAVVLRRRRGDPRSSRRAASSWPAVAVVTWAGARGVIPLAAALAVPMTTDRGTPFPHRPLLLVVATGVVVITLVVQGTTLEPVVRRLGVTGDPGQEAAQRERARYALATAALARLDELAAATGAPADDVVDRLRTELQARIDRARHTLGAEPATPSSGPSYDAVRRRLLDAEADELARLRSAGEVGAEVFRDLQRSLDLEAARLRL